MSYFVSCKKFFLDLAFPKFCFGCQKEGSYLCEDCLSLLEISEYNYCLCKKPLRLPQTGKCSLCRQKKLDGLYFAASYQNKILKKLIQSFKYEPYAKELSEPLTSLIIAHFELTNRPFSNEDEWMLIPVPLSKNKEKRRGFNQAEEIAKELSEKLKLPLVSDALVKTKETLPQVDLEEKERMENIKGAFALAPKAKIKNKKIMLADDVYTTGATMEECARVLKNSGAKEIWGTVVARG